MTTTQNKEDMDLLLMMKLLGDGKIENTFKYAKENNVDPQVIVGITNSLSNGSYVVTGPAKSFDEYELTTEGQNYLKSGTPESEVIKLLKDGPLTKNDLKAKYPAADLGIKAAMNMKLLAIDKGQISLKPDAVFTDPALADLKSVADGTADAKTAAALKQRKLCAIKKRTYFEVQKGANFPATEEDVAARPWKVKLPADFNAEQMKEMWEKKQTIKMKPANLAAAGKKADMGNLHPLMKLRQEYRQIFLELGFQEMNTARFVDSSFWNFDTLFIPQQHPARDVQDTFFVKDPEKTTQHPPEFVELTRQVHSDGLFGSTGYKYQWSEDETQRNVLRTHTTAISSYTLYNIGQEYQRTGKLQTGAFFSIDRVFRNEQVDKTHLCEFHQMEGFVLDYGLSLSNMMALLKAFFERVGITNLKFKPAYNPYTEPSMEIHTQDEKTGKIMEIGNSGMFRPEMLRPMGIPEGVTAIAWGLGLERVAMRHYKLKSIHELFGHKISLPFVKSAGAPRV
eukprot:TRINITY_DN12811_c0_g1_i1.p1 TRINITY_DN12811_c0_g1~~TRINITY_DN12811_c0_g1_i1.p1  ORF type:complete len:557 (+),score=103.02 TRINITY_DN12811_c0_g1_i1:146-1672(+)